MKPILSDNDRNVLKILLEDGRMNRSEIGRRIGISSQAVGKIEKKLTEKGIIKGFNVELDYERMGIGVIAIAMFRIRAGWDSLSETDMGKRVKGPHILRLYRFPDGDITHMVVYGFRTIKEMDHYFHILQTERGHISELVKLHVLSNSSVMKDDPSELFQKLIDELDSDALARPSKPVDETW